MFQDAEDITPIIEGLNSAQKEAVTAPQEHRLVLAGAGSGKTRVLIHRVAWLMAVEGVSPFSILAVTFTNKAAAEMRGRIERMVDVPVSAMWVGTFHGIAHRMLRLHWKEAGLVQGFQIMDSDDQLRFVKRTLKALDLPEDRWPAKSVTGFINSQKEEGLRPGALQDSGDFSFRQLVRIYAAYQSACDRAGLVDFSELLLRAHELCRDNAEIQQHYRNRFRHLLVDEFQDTNTLQYAWLRTLAGQQGRMFAVGDDDQSIYSWRGAKVENMQRFNKDFAGAQTVRLEQNYRSTGTILKAANGLISRNAERLGKDLWTEAGDGPEIQLYRAFNDFDETEFVVNQIQAGIREGGNPSHIAILYRSNAQSRLFEEGLIRQKIPYRIYGGLRFFERMEVKDALAYLRLIANRGDDTALERIINTPTRGIGATTVERLRQLAREADISMWDAAEQFADQLGRSAGKVQLFQEMLRRLSDEVAEMPLSRATEIVINRSGLRGHYEKESAKSRADQAEARLENLDELVNAAKSFEYPDDEALDPLSEFLTHAALEAGERQAGEGEDCVQMMTLHSAKGLEFPIVFLVGLEQGLFPHGRAMEEGSIEEERRLCYVGMTRAMQRLYLSHAEIRRLHGSEQVCTPSQFLKEIPSECLVEVRPRVGVRRPMQSFRPQGYMPQRPRVSEATVGGLKLGQSVSHPRFGEGMVVSFDGDGDRARVEVNFVEAGSKWLMLAYAKLSPL